MASFSQLELLQKSFTDEKKLTGLYLICLRIRCLLAEDLLTPFFYAQPTISLLFSYFKPPVCLPEKSF